LFLDMLFRNIIIILSLLILSANIGYHLFDKSIEAGILCFLTIFAGLNIVEIYKSKKNGKNF